MMRPIDDVQAKYKDAYASLGDSRGGSYEEGIRDALSWVLGYDNELEIGQ